MDQPDIIRNRNQYKIFCSLLQEALIDEINNLLSRLFGPKVLGGRFSMVFDKPGHNVHNR